MRRTVLLGFGLLLAGAALVLASTGGFDTAIADRNTDLADAPDPEALLNITYPSG